MEVLCACAPYHNTCLLLHIKPHLDLHPRGLTGTLQSTGMMLGGRNVLFNHWLPESSVNVLQDKRDSALQLHPSPPNHLHSPTWAVLSPATGPERALLSPRSLNFVFPSFDNISHSAEHFPQEFQFHAL